MTDASGLCPRVMKKMHDAISYTTSSYDPPFPYFGGKSAVAADVWAGIGDVDNFVEPFFGSGAVTLARPGGASGTETINDADGFVANFWRALKHDPDAVAKHADNPVNECDIHARHLWLIGQRERMTDRLCGDPDYYDAKAAGWWAWGMSCWIGGGWCSGKGPWVSVDGVMVNSRKLPHLGGTGQGVNRKLPHLGDAGKGVNRQLPHLGGTGQGVNRKLPHLGDAGQGECEATSEHLRGYMRRLADRLRRVRVCCGDWSRVCGSTTTTTGLGLTGVFLDPPYSAEAGRDMGCYAIDCGKVAHDIRKWAIREGENPKMRIVLAGYEREHTMPSSWRKLAWNANGGYANSASEGRDGTGNYSQERLWFSPHCIRPDDGLFGVNE